MRQLVLICAMLIVAGRLCAADPAPPSVIPAKDLLTKEEAKEVDAVIRAVIAAGFPDAANSSVHSGKLVVSATYDPDKDPAPLPSSASTMQATIPNTSRTTYTYTFEGLHFKLADGSWLISLAYHFKPAAGDKVNDADAPEIKLAELTATAIKDHPFDAEKEASKWLEGLDAPQRPRAAAAMNLLLPVTFYLKLGADDLAPAIVLLHAAGWPDAAAASLSLADQRARNYWQLRPWMPPDMPFDPSGVYPNSKTEEEAWRKAHTTFTPEPPQTALRRALYRWCRGQLTVESSEDGLFPPEIAAKTAKAMVEPNDPQKNAAKIDAQLAGAKLPVTPAENADLAGKLQSWEARQRMPRMVVKGGGGNKNPSISTSFEAPVAAYTPDKKDLDALVALLGDDRPSRFFDFNGARTVGENAWRALAALLKADPRTLAAYAIDKPWTTAEHHAASTAVQTWWKAHRTEYIDK